MTAKPTISDKHYFINTDTRRFKIQMGDMGPPLAGPLNNHSYGPSWPFHWVSIIFFCYLSQKSVVIPSPFLIVNFMYLFSKIDSTLIYYAFCDCMPNYFHFEGILVIHVHHTHEPVKKWWKKSKILLSGLLSEKMRSSYKRFFSLFVSAKINRK